MTQVVVEEFYTPLDEDGDGIATALVKKGDLYAVLSVHVIEGEFCPPDSMVVIKATDGQKYDWGLGGNAFNFYEDCFDATTYDDDEDAWLKNEAYARAKFEEVK